MGTTYYYTVNDIIIGEHTLGQNRLDYVTDALGSVVATIDQNLAVQSTTRYKPFGADLATTGTQPMFGYNGNRGYRRTGLPHADLYVRARHLGTVDSRWTTLDPIWPRSAAYGYVGGKPTRFIDRNGLRGSMPGAQLPPSGPPPAGSPTCGEPWNTYIWKYCNACYYGSSHGMNCTYQCDQWSSQYYSDCHKCNTFGPVPPGTPWIPNGPGGPVIPIRSPNDPFNPNWPPLPPAWPVIGHLPGPVLKPGPRRPGRRRPPGTTSDCFEFDCELDFSVFECQRCAKENNQDLHFCNVSYNEWLACAYHGSGEGSEPVRSGTEGESEWGGGDIESD